ncbi:Uncharacterised protein [Mycobacteroides abscessus subsp. abscessus]|nr:Uncharacterised protein [Mycobacteroides abscessus subsp. abscessus]
MLATVRSPISASRYRPDSSNSPPSASRATRVEAAGTRLRIPTPLRPFTLEAALTTCHPEARAGASASRNWSSSARTSCRHTMSELVCSSQGSSPRFSADRSLTAARMPLTLMVVTVIFLALIGRRR